MKIAVINNIYSRSASGGAEKAAEKIVAGLKERGHDVFVVACVSAPQSLAEIATRPSRPQPLLPRTGQVAKEGSAYYLPSIFSKLEKYPLTIRFFWHLWDFFSFGHARNLKNILLKEKPDMAITNNLKGVGFFVPGLLRKLKIRHFHILHDIQLLHPSGLMIWGKEKIINTVPAKIYQLINRALFASPEIIISPSKWLLDRHIKKKFFKNSKKIVLPNFFPAENDIPNSIRRPADPISRFQFLFVGKLEEHKGIGFLIKVFLKFLEKYPQAELSIVGGGSQRGDLEKLAASSPALKILGLKNSQEIKELMRCSGCLIVPSLCYENSPTVIYEAIGAGLPVIASRLGGIPELLEAAGGLAFEPLNEADLLDKMELIFTRSEESDRIKKKEAEYRPESYIKGILSL